MNTPGFRILTNVSFIFSTQPPLGHRALITRETELMMITEMMARQATLSDLQPIRPEGTTDVRVLHGADIAKTLMGSIKGAMVGKV